jgi:hypothetical protein
MPESRSTDPFSYLPYTVPALFVGVGMLVYAGTVLYDRAPADEGAAPDTVALRGTVEWAGWRHSARGDGPARFLQVRLAGDPRGFLVAAADLSPAVRDRLRRQARGGRIPALEGGRATVVIDAAFRERPRAARPYLRGLRVDGTTIVRPAGADVPAAEGPGLLLAGLGLLVGLGVTGACLHHFAVCVRHGRGA